jgi:23S rRNA (pseudouridine1915-N3)-methyltransferase
MVNIKLVVVGKLKEKYHKDEVNEYLKRLSRYCKISIIEVNEEKIKENASKSDIDIVLLKEGNNLLKQIKMDDYVILLDLHGENLSSENFAKKMDGLISLGTSSICFVIGGSYGLSAEVRNRSNFKLKLSDLTFTHQMTRVIILEQIYRCFKINNDETYHK